MSWKFKQIEPQPARGRLREEVWDDPNWIAEEKYDGDRRIAQFCGKVVRFTGRRQSVKDGLFVEKTENVPHLSDSFASKSARLKLYARVPAELDGTVLDGEIVSVGHSNGRLAPGGLSKYVTSIMGSTPEEAIQKQIERGWLQYVVFDCLFYKGKDIRGETLLARKFQALKAVETWSNPFVSVTKPMQAKRGYYKAVVAGGGEGVILKNLDHKYGDKGGWVKVKYQATADVVIMGFQAAKEVSKKTSGEVSMTKYAKAGLIGAIVCGQWNQGMRVDGKMIEVATVSGMTDDVRKDLTQHGKKYLGLVIEIEHNGREPTGRFRHPRFKCFRPDKTQSDCIFNLEES